MKTVLFLILALTFSASNVVAQSSGDPLFFDDHIDTVTVDAFRGPTIQFLTYRISGIGPLDQYRDVIVDIHFIAPMGNAMSTYYNVLEKTSGDVGDFFGSKPILNSADAQRDGTYVRMGVNCNKSKFYLTSEAYIVDSRGNHSNTVRFTLHCNGNSLPYVTQQLQVGPTYVDTAIPHTGTEAALRSYIEGWEDGMPPNEILSTSLATETQSKFAAIKKLMDGWGSLKSITFKTVDDKGLDTYSVEFEHGTSIWLVPQLTAEGKLGGLSFGPSAASRSAVVDHSEQSSSISAPH